MSYTSLGFLIFVTATILVYFLFPVKKFKWVVLLAASLAFYLFAGYKYIAFILFTMVSAFLCALWIEKIAKNTKERLAQGKGELSRDEKKAIKDRSKRNKRLVLALALALNFGILAFLKYAGFLAGSFAEIFGLATPNLGLVLPLGISFYTFQSMGYIVDVYREKVPAQRNIAKFALFVSFFPQIVQGPIGIYSDLAEQLYAPHSFDFTRFKHGCELILWGLVKKMIIADRAVIAIKAAQESYATMSGTTLTFTIILYSLQLYADFSGGIDISRGVAEIFGIDMMENFRRPYFAKDISEYWRRWHISLGNWFKNYLFYPLAMSSAFLNMSKNIKKTRFGSTTAGSHIAKVLPTSIASFIVFFMVGIWHGASYNYVAFGVYNGAIIMLAVLLKPVFEWTLNKLHIKAESGAYTVFRIVRTYLLVLVGYVFDVAPDFNQSMRTFGLFFTGQNFAVGIKEIGELGLSVQEFILLGAGVLLIFFVSLYQERHDKITVRSVLDKKPFIVRWAVVFAAVIALVVFGIYGSGYNAADFVYMQF